ncbi:hypothetical protein DH2020_043987 [Rehmannia glutinosa]|uniref:Nudix hydrolase domain-containing protein n=1 Tax=Rehmannia glutinosa TaxID=99300 RepID=A0ABR0UI49_REHGL
MAARTGRHLQRYNQDHRLVVGYKNGKNGRPEPEDDLEVLVISSKKSEAMMFPKGGWEVDESVEEAASRESLEEAGVLGNVEMSVAEAREVCTQWWMKEALEILVDRLKSPTHKQENQADQPI